MKKLILALYVCCTFCSFAKAELYIVSECTAAQDRCDDAKAKVNYIEIEYMSDMEHRVEVLRAKIKADNICVRADAICAAEKDAERREREKENARRQQQRAHEEAL